MARRKTPKQIAKRILKKFNITMLPEREQELMHFMIWEIADSLIPPLCEWHGTEMKLQRYRNRITRWFCEQCAEHEISAERSTLKVKNFVINPPVRELLCQICEREYPVWFAPNELWNSVTNNYANIQFLCLTCFANLAEANGIIPAAWKIEMHRQIAD